MANAAYKKDVQLDIDAGGYNSIPGIDDASLSFNGDTLDVTTFLNASTNNGARSKIYGLRDASLSLSGNFEDGETQKDALINNFLNSGDTTLIVRYFPTGDASGNSYFQFEIKVESFEPSGSVDGKEEISFSIQSTGAISYDTVS